MELDEFISETLRQILSGVAKAQETDIGKNVNAAFLVFSAATFRHCQTLGSLLVLTSMSPLRPKPPQAAKGQLGCGDWELRAERTAGPRPSAGSCLLFRSVYQMVIKRRDWLLMRQKLRGKITFANSAKNLVAVVIPSVGCAKR